MMLVWATMLPVLRILLVILSLVLMIIWLNFALLVTGHCRGDDSRPLGPVSLALLRPLNWLFRVILFSFGVFWVRESQLPGSANLRGRNAPKIIVSNHCTVLDALYFGSRCLPVIVCKADLVKLPILGNLLRAMRPVLVPRTQKERSALPDVVTAIRSKATASNPRFPPVLIFPHGHRFVLALREGTCVNNRVMIQFQRGAFLPQLPVQPVIMKYNNPHCDVSWTADISMGQVLFRCLSQWYVSMSVTYLPIYSPSADEMSNADLYAANVRATMAAQSNTELNQMTNADNMLFGATLRREASLAAYTMNTLMQSVETKQAMSYSRQHFTSLVGLAQAFKKADETRSGVLTMEDFQKMFPESVNRTVPQLLFRLFDKEGNGVLDWKTLMLAVGQQKSDIPPQDMFNLAFEIFDADNSGRISCLELRRVIAAVPNLSSTPDETVKELIDHFDVNHDGQIDRTEFALLCETRPELMTGAIRALMQEFELTTPKAVTTTQSPASEIQSGDVRVDMIPLKPDSDHK